VLVSQARELVTGALRRHTSLEPAAAKLAQGLQLWAAQQQQQQPGVPPLSRACQAAADAVVALLLQQLAAGDTSAGEEAGRRQLWWQQVRRGWGGGGQGRTVCFYLRCSGTLQCRRRLLHTTWPPMTCAPPRHGPGSAPARCRRPCPQQGAALGRAPCAARLTRPARPQVADATNTDVTKFTDGEDEDARQAPSQQQLEDFCAKQLQQQRGAPVLQSSSQPPQPPQPQAGRRRGKPDGAAGATQPPGHLELLCQLEAAACKHFRAEGFEALVKGWWASPAPPSLLALVQGSSRLRSDLEAALAAAQQAWASRQQKGVEGASGAEDGSGKKGAHRQEGQQQEAQGATAVADPAAVAAAVRAQQHLLQEAAAAAAAPAAGSSQEAQAAAALGQLFQALEALEAGAAAHLGLGQPAGVPAFSLLSHLGSASSGSGGGVVLAAVQAALLPLLPGPLAGGGGRAGCAAALAQELRSFCQQALAAAGRSDALPGGAGGGPRQPELAADAVHAVEAAACAHFGAAEFESLGQGPAAQFLPGLLAAGQAPAEAGQQLLYAEALLASAEAGLQPSAPHKASEAAVLAMQQAAGGPGGSRSPLDAAGPLVGLEGCSLWQLLWQRQHGSLPAHAAVAAAQGGSAGRRLLQLGGARQHVWVDAAATAEEVARRVAAGDGAGAAAALVGVVAGHGGLAATPVELLRALCAPACRGLAAAVAAGGQRAAGVFSLGLLAALPAPFRRRRALLELLLPPALCAAEAAGGPRAAAHLPRRCTRCTCTCFFQRYVQAASSELSCAGVT
jgi:hypothetical protein